MYAGCIIVILVALSAIIPTSMEARPEGCHLSMFKCELDCQKCVGGGSCKWVNDCVICNCPTAPAIWNKHQHSLQ